MTTDITVFFQIQSPQLPVTPEMVRPYPKAPVRKKAAHRRVSGKSQILTDSPVKAAITSLKENSKAKMRKKSTKNSTARTSAVKRLKCDSDVPCLYCGEMWSASREQWIRCQGRCAEWAHSSCAGWGKKTNTLCVSAVDVI